MTDLRHNNTLSTRLVSRGGAWSTIAITLIILTGIFGLLGQPESPSVTDHVPADSESARVTQLLEKFPDADQQSVLVLATPDHPPLKDSQISSLNRLGDGLQELAAAEVSEPIISDDGAAALLVVPLQLNESNVDTADTIQQLRSYLETQTPSGLTTYVTGGPAFGADIASAFDNADFTLLAVTIIIVALLLIITYRSPVLWLIPLTVVAIADRLASILTATMAQQWELQFDAGIISVLVFGAGTNYALLLISRYREELLSHAHHRDALSSALRKATPSILASNITTVAAVLTLTLAVIPGTRGIGVAAAAGLLIALTTTLILLPAVLAVCGRNVFWPYIPRTSDTLKEGGVWQRIATRIMRKPALSFGAGMAVLVVMVTGLFGSSIGLDQLEKFRVPSESAAGLEVLSQHYPAGEAQPIHVVTATPATEQTLDAITNVDGIVRAHPVAESTDGSLTQLMVTSEHSLGTDQSLEQIQQLRDAVHTVPEADALVGGAGAEELDSRNGNMQDLLLIAPLVLGIILVGLMVLLRAVVAPILLLLINAFSSLAAIGAGAWLSRVLFDQSALDHQVPLLAFLFLVALGIDYTIFLVMRIRTESGRNPSATQTREAVVKAVARTGSVITSAGVVLAGVFAALGLLPLVTLGQLGVIIGLGVLVDTLIVRTVMVPALFGLLGGRINS